MKIGSAWHNFTQEGKEYISITLNNDALPLVITPDKSITLWANEKTDKTTEKSPQYSVSISEYKPQKNLS